MPSTSPPPASPPAAGTSFRISMWAAGVLALAQIAAIGIAVVRQDLGSRPLAERRPAPQLPALADSTSVPAGFPPLERMFHPESMEPAPPVEGALTQRTTQTMVFDPEVRETLATARMWKEKGDVQSALEQFRAADRRLPNNPEILYELANCYEMLDLEDDAANAWTAIYQLGPERGSDFYRIAELTLLGSDDGAAARRSLLSIEHTRLYQHPQETSGEMRTLRVSIKAAPGAEIDPQRWHLRVLFFDLVNGSTVAPGLHEGEYPQHLVTAPIDWKDSAEEIVDFVYFRPHALAEQRPGEQRQFYGFVAQLFYDDEWQDLVARPRTLPEEIRDMAPAERGRWTDPGGSRVEASLFPSP